MPSSYTPSASLPPTVTLPSGGDPRTAASVNLPFTQLSDWILYEASALVTSPAQITANQNNYGATFAADWSQTKTLRVYSDASRTINGFDSTASKKTKLIVNVGNFSISLAHLAGGQGTDNQVRTPNGVPFVLGSEDSVVIQHDAGLGQWRVVGGFCRSQNVLWGGTHRWEQACTFDIEPVCKAGLFIDSPTAEIEYVGGRTRTLYLPLTDATPAGAGHNSWALNNAGDAWFGVTNSAGLIFMPRLPSGSGVTSIKCAYTQPFSVSSGLELIASRMAYTTTGSSRVDTVSTTGPTTGVTDQVLTLSTSFFLDATHGLWIQVKSPGSNANLTFLSMVSVTFLDPGPRNT